MVWVIMFIKKTHDPLISCHVSLEYGGVGTVCVCLCLFLYMSLCVCVYMGVCVCSLALSVCEFRWLVVIKDFGLPSFFLTHT